jgi:hypothetical protein
MEFRMHGATIKIIKKHTILFNNFLKKIVKFMRCGKKHGRAGQATDGQYNMAHARCMLDTKGYKHALIICNNCCFPTTTMVARKCPKVTLYVHCLSS